MCRQWRASRTVCEHGRRDIRIRICRRSLLVLFCGRVSKLIECKYTGRQNTEDVGIKERHAGAGPKCIRNVLQSSVLLSSARLSVMPSSRCPWAASHSSSYSVSPASYCNGKPGAGLGSRRGSEVVWFIVSKIVVAATDGDEAVPPPRYTFLVLFRQLFVNINLSSCHDGSLEDGGRRHASSVVHWFTRPTT